MNFVLADTNAWSRFYRSDFADDDPVVDALHRAIETRGLATIGVVYLELLRGFTLERTRGAIRKEFEAVSFIEPNRDDYAAAADLSVTCRRHGVQLHTIDALIAQVCIAHNLVLLTADADFTHAAQHVPLQFWKPE